MLNILRDNAIGDNILLTLPLLVGYLIATRLPLTLCITAYCNVVLFLAIYSLATYVLCFAIPGIAGGLPYIGGFQDTAATMHNALFSVIISGAQFPRNFGITWEPGAFAILLIIAIFCTVFCYEKINKTNKIVESQEELFISIHTVKAHIGSMLKKSGADNRTLLVYMAAKADLV